MAVAVSGFTNNLLKRAETVCPTDKKTRRMLTVLGRYSSGSSVSVMQKSF